MAATKDGAHLAHLADAVTALAEQLAPSVKQATWLDSTGRFSRTSWRVLNALLETNQAQSEMLADILGAATQDAGPSPVAQALAALAAQVQQMDENQTSLIAQVAGLPEAIGRQFEASLKDWSTATAAKH